jgi:hypothetical protein
MNCAGVTNFGRADPAYDEQILVAGNEVIGMAGDGEEFIIVGIVRSGHAPPHLYQFHRFE